MKCVYSFYWNNKMVVDYSLYIPLSPCKHSCVLFITNIQKNRWKKSIKEHVYKSTVKLCMGTKIFVNWEQLEIKNKVNPNFINLHTKNKFDCVNWNFLHFFFLLICNRKRCVQEIRIEYIIPINKYSKAKLLSLKSAE